MKNQWCDKCPQLIHSCTDCKESKNKTLLLEPKVSKEQKIRKQQKQKKLNDGNK